MTRILFAIEETHKQLIQSAYFYTMIGAWEALRPDCFWNLYPFEKPDSSDEGFERLVQSYHPDLIVVAPVLHQGLKNITPGVLGAIKEEQKIPVVVVWGESAPDVVRWADYYAPHTTATVFFDTREHWRQFTRYPEKCVFLPEPKDPRIFYPNSEVERTIPVSFVGSLVGRWDRAFNLAILWSSGINVKKFGGLDDVAEPVEAYAKFLQRSLITLNFTSAISFQHINGRTSEATMSGALLFESQSQETSHLLQPEVHYVPFVEVFHINEQTGILQQQPGDMVEVLRRYLGEKAVEVRQIAERGCKRAHELFDGRVFWNEIFSLAGRRL